MARLCLYHISDILQPHSNTIKTWQQLNYEKNGKIKKGAKPNWYKILEQHEWPQECSFTDNTRSITKQPISYKKNRHEWVYDLKDQKDVKFGRIVKKAATNTQTRVIYYTHWIPTSDDANC